nr:MAG TPA: hypothetical protein [Caudoviricetes sp.]
MRTEPRRAMVKAPSRNQPRQDPDPPHAETRRPHAAHHPGQGGNRRTDPGHGRERITRQATARNDSREQNTRGATPRRDTTPHKPCVANTNRKEKPMPPYHHPKLPTDMLANFNDLHAEISALPRSRAQSLALTKLDEAFLWAKETTNETA